MEAAKYVGKENLNDLELPILIPSVDIYNGEKYVFTNCKRNEKNDITNSPIATAVRASCSYPGVFAPCFFRDHCFVDGGVLDNIPADEVKKAGADIVISVKFALDKQNKPHGIMGVALKSVDMIFDKLAEEETKYSDILLDVDLKNASIFNTKQIDFCYEKGYLYAKDKINEIIKIIKNKEEMKNGKKD